MGARTPKIIRRFEHGQFRSGLHVTTAMTASPAAHPGVCIKGLDTRWTAWETVTAVCRSLATVIRADPWGPVAQQVVEAVELSRPYGTSQLLTSVIDSARQEAADAELHVGQGHPVGRPHAPHPAHRRARAGRA